MSEKLDSVDIRGACERGDAKVSSVLGIKSTKVPRPETVEVPVEPTREMVTAAFEARDHVGNALSRAAKSGFSSGVMAMWGAMIAARPLAASPAAPDAGVESYPLSARVWRRESTQEWVLEIEGSIGETWLTCRHTEPLSRNPDEVPGLPSLYEADDEITTLRAQLAELRELLIEKSKVANGYAATIAAQAKRIAELEAKVAAADEMAIAAEIVADISEDESTPFWVLDQKIAAYHAISSPQPAKDAE